jgi:hypothetical protein
MIILEILRNPLLQDSRVVFSVPLSITSHLMFVDGEYRFDDTLLYGYRSTHHRSGLAHYGESLAAHSFLQGTTAHEI